VEFPVAHQSITEFMLLRKTGCLMPCKFGALKDAAEAHKALEARATSGSTILTI
jgi:hypothetical protein